MYFTQQSRHHFRYKNLPPNSSTGHEGYFSNASSTWTWHVRAIWVISTIFIPIFLSQFQTSAFSDLLYPCAFFPPPSFVQSVHLLSSFASVSDFLLPYHPSTFFVPFISVSLPCYFPFNHVPASYYEPSYRRPQFIIPSDPYAVRLFLRLLSITHVFFYLTDFGELILHLPWMLHQRRRSTGEKLPSGRSPCLLSITRWE